MKISKKLLSGMMIASLLAGNSSSVLACTGIYVGEDVSENGSTYMGRSEDIGNMYPKIFSVAPAKDWESGAIYKDAYGFEMPYPSHTYAYTYVKDTPLNEETITDEDGNYIGEAYGEAGQNEMGLAISATVSTQYGEQVEAVDPLVENGIMEISLLSVLLGNASTAREAVDYLAEIITTYGAGECNSLMMADADETWYFEIVSGHQYAAIKMPQDQVSVQPNIMLLGAIDVADTENVVVSPELVSLAEENGFLQTDENGNINVAKSYAEADSGKGQYSRYWQGIYYIDPEAAAELDVTEINNNVDPLPLFNTPNRKMSTLDVMQWLQARGEGSEMDSNVNPDIYAIGNERQAECHVFETRNDMPEQLATIQWQAMGDAEFSVYVPYYTALISETLENYHQMDMEPVDDSINWNFQQINDICYNNRDNCAENVKAYFEEYQTSLIEQQKAIDTKMVEIYQEDPALAAQKATDLGLDLATQVLAMSNSVVKELKEYTAGEMTEPFTPSAMTEKVMPEYSFDHLETAAAETAQAAETEEEAQTEKAESNGIMYGVFVVVIAAVAYVLIKKSKK